MRPSARPTSRSDLSTWSFSNSVTPAQINRGNRRPLIDDNDQHIAVDLEPHILEQPARVKRANRLSAAFGIETIANANRQIRKHSTRFSALHAFDADIAHDEFLREGR